MIWGDMKEDYKDKEEEGMTILDTIHCMLNSYTHGRNHHPSSRGNIRIIFHCFISDEIKKYITRLGICDETERFMMPDHITFFVIISLDLF